MQHIAECMQGIAAHGVIMVETRYNGYKLAVVLNVHTTEGGAGAGAGAGAGICATVAFRESNVITLRLAEQPTATLSFLQHLQRRGPVPKGARCEKPRRWCPVSGDTMPHYVRHLASIRKLWSTKLVQSAADGATAEDLCSAEPRPELVTPAYAQHRTKVMESHRRRRTNGASLRGARPRVAAFQPVPASNTTRCPAVGCTAPAARQRCLGCGAPLLCAGCDRALQVHLSGTGARWIGQCRRDAAVDERTLGAVFAPQRVRAIMEQTAVVVEACEVAAAAFAAESTALCDEVRAAGDALHPERVAQIDCRRAALEGALADKCAVASASARALLHARGMCWGCCAYSDCDANALPALDTIGVSLGPDGRAQRDALSSVRPHVAAVYNARILVREVMAAHVERYREASAGAVKAAVGASLAPCVEVIVESCRATAERTAGVTMKFTPGKFTPGSFGEGADSNRDPCALAAASRHVPTGSAAILFEAQPGCEGALAGYGWFPSIGATLPSSLSPSADAMRSVPLTVVEMKSVLVILMYCSPYFHLDAGRTARAAHHADAVALVPVDALLEREDVDAVAIVFVSAPAGGAADDAPTTTLILTAFAQLTVATARVDAAAPARVVAAAGAREGPPAAAPPPEGKEELARKWADIVQSTSAASMAPAAGFATVKPGYGPVYVGGATPMWTANYRTSGPNGTWDVAALHVADSPGPLTGRYSDSANTVLERGRRGCQSSLLDQGAAVPSSKPKARGSCTAFYACYAKREGDLGTRDAPRRDGGKAWRSGPPVSVPTEALARSVARLNGETPANTMARVCDVQGAGKVATALLAKPLERLGIPCCAEVHEVCLADAFRLATSIIAEEAPADVAAGLCVRLVYVVVTHPTTSLTRHHLSTRARAPTRQRAAQATAAAAPQLPVQQPAPLAFAIGYVARTESATGAGSSAWRRYPIRRRGGEAAVAPVDPRSVGFSNEGGLLHALRTYSWVREHLGRRLSAECNVTVQVTAVDEHVDSNSSKPEGFLEALSSVYVSKIESRSGCAATATPPPSCDRLEGALYMPRARIAVRRRPCWAIHIVYFNDEPHSVFAPPTKALALARGVGGDPEFRVATVADW